LSDRKEYNRLWHLKNRERRLLENKVRYLKQKEKEAVRSSAYHARPEIKAKEAARHRAYRLEHKEEREAYERAYRLEHKKEMAAYQYSYRLANLEKTEANALRQAAKRRARKKNAPILEAIEHAVVFERDGGVCGICGVLVDPANWHLDHVIPLSRGGEHSYANVQVSHPTCNLSKGAGSSGDTRSSGVVARATNTTHGQISPDPLTSRHG
jgi:5-methylcytosine-specific restriction endonuclease McrA